MRVCSVSFFGGGGGGGQKYITPKHILIFTKRHILIYIAEPDTQPYPKFWRGKI